MKNVTSYNGLPCIKAGIVMLPTTSLQPFMICTVDGRLEIARERERHLFNSKCKPQHLYFTTEEEPKDDDWCVAYQTVLSNNNQKGYVREHYTDVVQFGKNVVTSGRYDTIFFEKIVATTDESLGLPRPSNEFLQKYVEMQGKIKKCLIEVKYIALYEIPKIKTAPDNTITIHPLNN